MSSLINTFNNCFFNSIFQMLTSSDEIKSSFTKPSYTDFFNLYKENTRLNIFNIMNYYKKNLQKDIVWGMQHDANEILSYILDDADDKSQFEVKIQQKVYNPDEISETTTTENILIVPIKDSIQDSINSLFETVEASEEQAKIEYTPINQPNYLFVTLKRMEYSVVNGQICLVKIKKEINVSETITYCEAQYKSISYIIHQGELNHGHYLTLKIHEGKWKIFNDESIHELQNQDDGIKYQNIAYILLYQKVN